jgi:hypothetical protein
MEQIIGVYTPETLLSNNIEGTITIDTPSSVLNVAIPTNDLTGLVGAIDPLNDLVTIFDASTSTYVKVPLQNIVNDEVVLINGELTGLVPLGKELGIDTSTGKYYYKNSVGQWQAQPVGQTVSIVPNANGTITTNAGLGGVGVAIKPIDQQVMADTLLPTSRLTYLDNTNNHVSTTALAIANLSSNSWRVLGNSNTTPSLNFVGTTDSQPLIFKTNNTERARLDLSDALVLSSAMNNRRVVLYETIANDQHQFYGLGVNAGVFRFQVPVGAGYAFYEAINSTSSLELARLTRTGLDVPGMGYFGVQRSPSDALLSRGANILHAVTPNKITTATITPGETALRLIRAGSSGVVYNQAVDFNVGSYSTGLAASAQLDVALNTGNVHTPNVVVLSLLANKRVGINNNNPSQTLHVTDTNAAILVGDTAGDSGALYFGNTAHGLQRNYNNIGNNVGLYTTAGNIYLSGNGTRTDQFVVKNNGNVGIGTSTPNALLQLSNSVVNRKIVLYEGLNSDHEFYGFGINPGILRYQADTNASHVFYAANNSTSSNELVRITSTGRVGITNVPNPLNNVHIGTPSVANTTGIRTSITSASPATTETSYLAVNASGDIVKGATVTGGGGNTPKTAWTSLNATLEFGQKNAGGLLEYTLTFTAGQIRLRRNWGVGTTRLLSSAISDGLLPVIGYHDVTFPDAATFRTISITASNAPYTLPDSTTYEAILHGLSGTPYSHYVVKCGTRGGAFTVSAFQVDGA